MSAFKNVLLLDQASIQVKMCEGVAKLINDLLGMFLYIASGSGFVYQLSN